MKTRWHYTPTRTVPKIMASGRIKYMPKANLSMVWFSDNQLIEPSAKGLWTPETLPKAAGKVARLAVHAEFPLRRWEEVTDMLWRQEDQSTYFAVMGLELTGRGLGANPRQWWVYEHEVHVCSVTRCEKWDGEAWVPYHPKGWLGDLTAGTIT